MNTIKSTVSLLAAVSLMGFIMIAQHNFQLKFAPAAQGNAATVAVSGPETIALK